VGIYKSRRGVRAVVVRIGGASQPTRGTLSTMLVVIAILVAAACSKSPTTPSAPSPAGTSSPPPSPLPPPPTTTRQISGRVISEDGTPVDGATVVLDDGFGQFSAPVVTAGNGFYQASARVQLPPFHYFGTQALITRSGYEETDGWAPGTTDTTQDFRLYRPLTVTAGDAVHLAISPDNSLCGFELEFRCRAIHIQAPTSGTIALDTMADDPANVFWILVGRPVDIQYPFTGTTHAVISVTAGSSALIQIMRPWVIPTLQEFTLKTSRIQ
jgi:hypothetical protein